jgi:hypothetical protein
VREIEKRRLLSRLGALTAILYLKKLSTNVLIVVQNTSKLFGKKGEVAG